MLTILKHFYIEAVFKNTNLWAEQKQKNIFVKIHGYRVLY